MRLQKVLCVFFLTSVLSAIGKPAEEHAQITEKIIKKEIERFNTIKDKLVALKVDVIAQFSRSKVGEDDNLIKSDTFELRPLVSPKPGGDFKGFQHDTLKTIFKLANKYNVSVAASGEEFDKTGILTKKTVYTDYAKIYYDDGNSDIKIRDDPDDNNDDDDDDVEDLIGMVKEFELSVAAEKQQFDDTGSLIKTENMSYAPKKVRIDSVTGMSVDMQMKVCEALKRSCVMKATGTDRIKLLVRYLGIQFPEYNFHAAIGVGGYHTESDINIKVFFDDEMYYIWGTDNAKEDEDEEEED